MAKEFCILFLLGTFTLEGVMSSSQGAADRSRLRRIETSDELGLRIDGEGGADRREQTGLRVWLCRAPQAGWR